MKPDSVHPSGQPTMRSRLRLVFIIAGVALAVGLLWWCVRRARAEGRTRDLVVRSPHGCGGEGRSRRP